MLDLVGFRWFGGHEEGVLLLSCSLPGRLGSLVVISCCGGSLLNAGGVGWFLRHMSLLTGELGVY